MSKKIKYTVWIVLAVILLALIFLVALNNKTAKFTGKNAAQNSGNIPAQKENQNPSVPANTSVQAGKVVAPTPVALPVYTKEVALEFMTDAEKKTKGLPADMKVQVLERSADGKVTAYKIIRKDSDIMTKYGD